MIAGRPWLTVFYLPAYSPMQNPGEGVWSVLKRSLGNLAPRSTDALAALVKTRLRHMQYRTDGLLDGLVAETGLVFEPPLDTSLSSSVATDAAPSVAVERESGSDRIF